MRKGFLGSIAALAAGAGLAWGQSASQLPNGSPTGQAHVGGSSLMPVSGNTPPPIIPPSFPLASGNGGAIPTGGPVYPPPAHFAGVDPSNLPEVPLNEGGPEAPLFWMNADYLLYFVKSQPSRYPLVTTSNIASGGVLNQPTTTVLFGGSDISYNITNGFRVNGGYFRDSARRFGFEVGGFLMQEKTKTFTALSDAAGSPVLARPFVNVNTNAQSSLIITTPGVMSGGITVETTNQTWGGEGNFVLNLYRGCPGDSWNVSVNGIAGFRYVELEETLTISSSTNLLPGATFPAAFGVFPGILGPLGNQANLNITDNFRTLNQFYGGQLGLVSEIRTGKWSLLGTYKVAVGDVHTRVDVEGTTALGRGQNNLVVGGVRGGLLANAQNVGRDLNDRFGVIPELNMALGYHITPCLTFTVGYNFLYMTNVVRPGEILEPRTQPGLIPASGNFGTVLGVLPRFDNFRESDYFLQGVSFGLSYRY
jgi:hypothetical protein